MFLQEYRVDGFRYDQNMVIDDDGGAEGWRFLQDLTSTLNVFYVHENDRIIAWHRWLEGMGCDVVMVASLNEATFSNYQLGMPQGGEWREVFNSDVMTITPTRKRQVTAASFSPVAHQCMACRAQPLS